LQELRPVLQEPGPVLRELRPVLQELAKSSAAPSSRRAHWSIRCRWRQRHSGQGQRRLQGNRLRSIRMQLNTTLATQPASNSDRVSCFLVGTGCGLHPLVNNENDIVAAIRRQSVIVPSNSPIHVI
jgi:hypothetical protein